MITRIALIPCSSEASLRSFHQAYKRGVDWLISGILLSHHQYFSRFDNFYVKPANQMAEFFPRPVLWFWGHEHRMAIYPEYAVAGGLRAHGRCVGHGGMPVDPPPAKLPHPECPVPFVDLRDYLNDENLKIGYNGFARLTLNG